MDQAVLECGACGGAPSAVGGVCPRCGEAPARSVPPLQPGDPVSIGRFRLLGRLGAGGMGVVFLGRDGGGRLAALKVVRAELASQRQFRVRFAREVASAAAVSGRFTARVLDRDLDGAVQWVATQYVAGPTLAEQVEQHGALPAGQARLLALGLAEALRAIHEVGLVHRDLKPSNVILSADGPKVIDFGIAQSLDATSLTETGAVVGTMAWLAPEQVTGGGVRAATDIFAWGLVVAYAALGRHPYGQGRPEAIAFRVVNQEPDLQGLPPSLAPAVAAVLRRQAQARVPLPDLLALLGDPDRTIIQSTVAAGWDATVAGPMPTIPATSVAVPGGIVVPRRRGRRARRRPVAAGVAALALITAGGVAAVQLIPDPAAEQQQSEAPTGSSDGQPSAAPDGGTGGATGADAPQPTSQEGGPPSFGPLYVGMSIAEAEATGLVSWNPDFWGPGAGALAASEDWWFPVDNGSIVTGFTVKGPGWATPEGIAVGSSKALELTVYPEARYAENGVPAVLVLEGVWGYQFFYEQDGTISSITWGLGVGVDGTSHPY